MKVSIITACYNRVGTVGDAIESVLAQDYPDIEYIVVDGASKDGSVEVIEKYNDKISKFVSEPDHGMYEAINKGIRMATGDIIGLVHSDDMLFDEHVISDIVQEMQKTDAEFLYGNGIFVDKNNMDKIVRKWHGGGISPCKVRHGWLPLHPTCYIRNETLRHGGLYDESYKIAADSDFLVRYLLPGNLKVVYLDRNIIRMRMGGLSTDSKRRKQMWDEDVRMYASHGLPPIRTKLLKMCWKIPQFFSAKLSRL